MICRYYLGEYLALVFIAALETRPDLQNPQCAVIGLPGQIGQTSPAAWSQTVITKSICGSVRRKRNSSQLLLRNPDVS